MYLKRDVLLFADVFEKCRDNSLKNYGLCRSHYLSTPAFSWDAMLNLAKVELELITAHHMYIFFEKGMRGRVSYISNRYSQASDKYLKSYNQKKNKKILYT